jgi:hypothetical protein
MEHNAITDLVFLLKVGCSNSQMLAAATIAELAQGYIFETVGHDAAFGFPSDRTGQPSTRMNLRRESVFKLSLTGGDDGAAKRPAVLQRQASMKKPPADATNRLTMIGEAQGLAPLIKVCSTGGLEARAKAVAALWHLALDEANQAYIGGNGGINPIVGLLAVAKPPAKVDLPEHPLPPPPPPLPCESFVEAQKYALRALSRLAKDSEENQSMMAKCLGACHKKRIASIVDTKRAHSRSTHRAVRSGAARQ